MVKARTTTYILPIVGIVVTISPSLSLYSMVVFPAASKPTIKILMSFLEKRPLNNDPKFPMLKVSTQPDEKEASYNVLHA